MALPQYVQVQDYREVAGNFAIPAGKAVVNRNALLFRKNSCDKRFGKTNKGSLFIYFDDTSKKIVSADNNGKNAINAPGMLEVDSFKLSKGVLDNRAVKECEKLQVRIQGAQNDFVMSRAKEVKARVNGVGPRLSFYEIYHDDVLVGITNQAGYDAITNPA